MTNILAWFQSSLIWLVVCAGLTLGAYFYGDCHGRDSRNAEIASAPTDTTTKITQKVEPLADSHHESQGKIADSLEMIVYQKNFDKIFSEMHPKPQSGQAGFTGPKDNAQDAQGGVISTDTQCPSFSGSEDITERTDSATYRARIVWYAFPQSKRLAFDLTHSSIEYPQKEVTVDHYIPKGQHLCDLFVRVAAAGSWRNPFFDQRGAVDLGIVLNFGQFHFSLSPIAFASGVDGSYHAVTLDWSPTE